MSYGMPSREEVKHQRAAVAAAQQAAQRMQQFKDWAASRSEAIACGLEFPTFSEWLGETSLKAAAVDRYMRQSDDDYGVVA